MKILLLLNVLLCRKIANSETEIRLRGIFENVKKVEIGEVVNGEVRDFKDIKFIGTEVSDSHLEIEENNRPIKKEDDKHTSFFSSSIDALDVGKRYGLRITFENDKPKIFNDLQVDKDGVLTNKY